MAPGTVLAAHGYEQRRQWAPGVVLATCGNVGISGGDNRGNSSGSKGGVGDLWV